MATLIVFSGRSGTGKSSIARALVKETGALWLRVDVINQAIKDSGVADGCEASYNVAYALATQTLSLGCDVIGDSMNSCCCTRDNWRVAGEQTKAKVIEVETVCSDSVKHRQRYEVRKEDVLGLIHLEWEKMIRLEYQEWTRDHLTIDTAKCSIDEATKLILAEVHKSS